MIKSANENMDDWIPLSTARNMSQTEYDVIIVGSGAGGGAALWRLCQQWKNSGRRIGLIESGPLLLPTHGRNMATMNEERFTKYFENPLHTEYIGKSWPEYPGAKMIKALGGRTLQWYMVSPRLNPEDFHTWPITYDELVPYYLTAEQMMNVTSKYAAGSSIQQILLERLRSNGFPGATDTPLAADLEPTRFGRVHSNVFFSSIDFLAYALNTRPFDLAVRTQAVRVLIDKGKTAGVEVMTPDFKTHSIRAKTVILSCGTWETPRLLLHSGIPGRAIGHYLTNHMKVFADVKGARSQFGEAAGVASLWVPVPGNKWGILYGFGTSPFDYFWYAYEQKPLLSELKFRMVSAGPVEQRYENHVFLEPGTEDEYGIPRLQVSFSHSNQDRARIPELFRTMRAAVHGMGLDFDKEPWLIEPGEDNHECGTCRIGLDPDTSATNPYGQIHGIPGLYVADSSVIRLTGPANPMLTTVALALRTADYISQTV
ncbi:GMC family oxidoreductase [Paenibacillus sp. N4]|uniref:GMC oxidoreductase n=1 Tax=Paenibacillus vietnamensis TaxID=2590547 RepID=UPI001CD10F69|nr:GMC family oxidoreductase [Paenibacillus vietnamensis]MCA0757201.1 GMC family oxidoreductase [Paenibacillus vietnamensis]